MPGRAHQASPQAAPAAPPRLAVLDALLDYIGDQEAEATFIDGLTGALDLRAGELAETMIARAGRQ